MKGNTRVFSEDGKELIDMFGLFPINYIGNKD